MEGEAEVEEEQFHIEKIGWWVAAAASAAYAAAVAAADTAAAASDTAVVTCFIPVWARLRLNITSSDSFCSAMAVREK